MSGTIHNFPDREPAPEPAFQPSAAPILPIEGHIVAAALAIARAKQQCEQLLTIVQHAPRRPELFTQAHDALLAAWCDMDEHYRAYQAVLECEGQA
jgi:hypothetical protein